LRSSYRANGIGIGVVPQKIGSKLRSAAPPRNCRVRFSIGEPAVSGFVNKLIRRLPMLSPNAEAKMRVVIPTLVGLVALATASVQAAPVPSKPHHSPKWHETPAQNVRKSQQYNYLVETNGSFRAYRMRKECGPIRDPELRANCLGSFSVYEPR
jgi:hypothetical protein